METSFMYHALGIREQECTRTRYEGGRIIFEIRTKEDKLYCARCGSRHVIKSGGTIVVGHGEGHSQGRTWAQVQPTRPQRSAVHRHRRVRRGQGTRVYDHRGGPGKRENSVCRQRQGCGCAGRPVAKTGSCGMQDRGGVDRPLGGFHIRRQGTPAHSTASTSSN